MSFKPSATWKRGTVAAVAMSVVLVLAGCATSSPSGSSSTTACNTKDPVALGAQAPLSGPVADLGLQSSNGAKIGVAEVNAAGGINGHCVQLFVEDDGGDPTKAAQVGRKLVDQDSVVALVGPVLSGTSAAVLPLTKDAGIVQIVNSALPAAGDPSQFPFSFGMTATNPVLNQTYLAYIKKGGYKKVGIVAVNNPYGTDMISSFGTLNSGTGLKLVGTEYVESGGVDFSSSLAKLKADGADVVLSYTAGDTDNAAVVKARNAVSWDVPILGAQTFADPFVTQAVGADGMKNVLVAANVYLTRTPGSDAPQGGTATSHFRSAYLSYIKDKTYSGSVFIAAMAYDSVLMVAKAMNKTGSTDASDVTSYLVKNGYTGAAAKYEFSKTNHSGITVKAMTMAAASSIKGSFLDAAPAN